MKPAGVLALGLFVAACDDDRVRDSEYGRLVYDVGEGSFPDWSRGAEDPDYGRAFLLQLGYAEGDAYEYLDLGPVNPAVPRVYLLERDGRPIEGQYPIVDTLPDDAEYSPFWQIVRVEVDGDYEANDIKSLGSLEDADFDQTPTLEALHCPIVNPDARYVGTDSVPLIVFAGTGEPVPNPAYNLDPKLAPVDKRVVLTEADRTPADLVLQPFWHKRLLGFCWAPEPDRRFPLRQETVEGKPTVLLMDAVFGARFDLYQALPDGETGEPGVQWGAPPIFEQAPGGAGYSPARQVLAVLTDTGDPRTSASEIDATGAIPLDLVDNPIVRAAPEPPAEGP